LTGTEETKQKENKQIDVSDTKRPNNTGQMLMTEKRDVTFPKSRSNKQN
jgi:hypothetical protein